MDFKFLDPEAARSEISDLLEAAFGPIDPEAATVWHLSAEEDVTAKQSADRFEQAANAEDPLAFLAGEDSVLRARLNALMRVRWAARHARAAGHPETLSTESWPALSEAARKMVRDGLRHLASFDATRVRRGAPSKAHIDTVIYDLAEIFARHTGFIGHQTELPHAQGSHFIQFVQTALTPYLSLTELEADAISKRWKRYKQAHGFGVNQVE